MRTGDCGKNAQNTFKVPHHDASSRDVQSQTYYLWSYPLSAPTPHHDRHIAQLDRYTGWPLRVRSPVPWSHTCHPTVPTNPNTGSMTRQGIIGSVFQSKICLDHRS